MNICALTFAAMLSVWPIADTKSPEAGNIQPVFWEASAFPYSAANPPALSATGPRKDYNEALGQVEKHKNQGELAKAIALIKSWPKTLKENPDVLVEKAIITEMAGNHARALALYEKVLASGDTGRARALASEHYRLLLRELIDKGKPQYYWPLTDLLKKDWRNEDALALIDLALTDPRLENSHRQSIMEDAPLIALRLGRFERAAGLLTQPATLKEHRIKAQYNWRTGQFKDAAESHLTLSKLESTTNKKNRQLKISFEALAKGGLYDEALAFMEKQPYLKNEKDNLQWQLGLSAFLAHRYQDALTHFENVENNNKLKDKRAGAIYYQGRAQEMLGNQNQARQLFQKAAEGTFSYYQILAKGRLKGGRQVYLAAPLAALLAAPPLGRDQDSLGFVLWINEKAAAGQAIGPLAESFAAAAGEDGSDAVRQAMMRHLRQNDWLGAGAEMAYHQDYWTTLKSGKKWPAEAAAIWPKLGAALAAHTGQYRLSVKMLSKIKGDGTPGLKKWSHPLVYSRQAADAYRRHGLPPQLLLALIRTESAFMPEIISVSNARGLMQILPATANKIAAELDETPPGALELFEPDYNIRFGAWYLDKLIRGFNGQVALALASYNGGPYNIKMVVTAKPGQPLDVFIDTLPVDENATYVKRIMESRYIYEEAYLGQANYLDFSQPVKEPNAILPTF